MKRFEYALVSRSAEISVRTRAGGRETRSLSAGCEEGLRMIL
jgi:hypothetical protein